jgi:hypothetical protein
MMSSSMSAEKRASTISMNSVNTMPFIALPHSKNET